MYAAGDSGEGGDDIILYYTINYITLHIIPTAGS